MKYQADLLKAREFLYRQIKKNADSQSLKWLDQQQERFRKSPGNLQPFYLAFSMSSRYFKKEDLVLNEQSNTEAQEIRKGLQPNQWNVLQSVRIFLLLLLPHEDDDFYHASLNKLFETADIEEQVALYSALPLLPNPDHFRFRATEGIRTNITSVFDAIALHNPYAADYLNQSAWNQMVLKAIFIQRPLYQIYGADERANSELARMIMDLVHERWAAGRKISPEVWRFVGPFINEDILTDIKKILSEGSPLEKEACLLACSLSSLDKAKQLASQYPEIQPETSNPVQSWNKIGKRFLNN